MFRATWVALTLLMLTPVPEAQAVDYATQVMESTFKLYHPDSTATCFLIKRDSPESRIYLVTAAHVLERTKGETATLVLRDAKDNTYVRHDHVIPVRHGETALWIKHPQHDIAVLQITAPLPVAVPVLSESVLAQEEKLKSTSVHIASPLLVMTYPQRFEAHPSGLPIARQAIFASPPTLPAVENPTFFVDFTTFAGDSGGPAFVSTSDNQPLIVGLVLAQSHQEEKTIGEYEEKLVRRPLGLGTVLHSRFIIETLNIAEPPPTLP